MYKSHVLSVKIQSPSMLSFIIVISAVFGFELIKCVMDMLVMIVDKLLHWVHGVGVINTCIN